MKLTRNLKQKIRAMDYMSMLYAWRFTRSVDDNIFQGESGDYFAKWMDKKRETIGNKKHVQISKMIGWK